MKNKIITFAALISLALCISGPLQAEGWVNLEATSKILVVPVLNTAFEEKDKFYGLNDDLSRNLQSFLSFTLDVLSDYNVAKTNADVLYSNYPKEVIYSGQGETLEEMINMEALLKAGKEYKVDTVLASRVLSTWVLVEGLTYSLKAEMEFVGISVESGEIVYKNKILGEDQFSYGSKKAKDKAGNVGDMSIGGRTITHAELAQDPIKFGGMVPGFPFLDLARKLCLDMRK